MSKTDGLPGFLKTLEIVEFIESRELTDDDIAESFDHWRKSDVTHGLLWGDISNFGREDKGLELLSLLCDVMKRIKEWRNDEVYPIAVVAANLYKTTKGLS